VGGAEEVWELSMSAIEGNSNGVLRVSSSHLLTDRRKSSIHDGTGVFPLEKFLSFCFSENDTIAID